MLKQYRNEIDIIDDQLINLLNERFKVTALVGKYKQDNNIEILNKNREAVIIDKIKNLKLDQQDQIIEVYKQILKTSKQQQNE